MRLNLVGAFLLKAIGWFIVCLVVWYQLGSLVTLPVGLLAKPSVAAFFPDWAEGVEQTGATLTLLTSLELQDMADVPAGMVALLSPEVSFLKYGYGLPLLIALLFASNAKHPFAKVALGALLLLPFQVWGVCFDWLKQVGIETDLASFSPLAREAIALGYQFGYLMLPTLVPVLLWAALDKRFMITFMLEATLQAPSESRPAYPSNPTQNRQERN
jgi:hypothetical protein